MRDRWSPGRERCWPVMLRFSPDGRWLAGTNFDGALELFDAQALTTTDELEPTTRARLSCAESGPSRLYDNPPRSAFAPDSTVVFTETGDGYRVNDVSRREMDLGRRAPRAGGDRREARARRRRSARHFRAERRRHRRQPRQHAHALLRPVTQPFQSGVDLVVGVATVVSVVQAGRQQQPPGSPESG